MRAEKLTLPRDRSDCAASTLPRHLGRLAADPGLQVSLGRFVGHPACGVTELRADMDRFTFLLGGSDGYLLAVR